MKRKIECEICQDRRHIYDEKEKKYVRCSCLNRQYIKEILISSGLGATPNELNTLIPQAFPVPSFGKDNLVIKASHKQALKYLKKAILLFPTGYFYFLTTSDLVDIQLNKNKVFGTLDSVIVNINHLVLTLVEGEIPNWMIPHLVCRVVEYRENRGKYTTIITPFVGDELENHYLRGKLDNVSYEEKKITAKNIVKLVQAHSKTPAGIVEL